MGGFGPHRSVAGPGVAGGEGPEWSLRGKGLLEPIAASAGEGGLFQEGFFISVGHHGSLVIRQRRDVPRAIETQPCPQVTGWIQGVGEGQNEGMLTEGQLGPVTALALFAEPRLCPGFAPGASDTQSLSVTLSWDVMMSVRSKPPGADIQIQICPETHELCDLGWLG